MLCSFGHHVAMCCDMLGVVGSSLKMVTFGPTTRNTSQHVATGWPNARNMLRPTMLRYVELACCDRLAGALNVKFGNETNKRKYNSFPYFSFGTQKKSFKGEVVWPSSISVTVGLGINERLRKALKIKLGQSQINKN